MLKVIILAVVIGCAAALTTPCRTCTSKGKLFDILGQLQGASAADTPPSGTCQTVTIDPCTVQPCTLKKNTNVTFSVQFIAAQASSALTSEVYGVIDGVPVKFPLPNPDGCLNSGIQCPLVAGQTYTYTNSLFINPSYPSINLVVKWSLLDDKSNPIFCVVAPAKISA